MQPANTVVVRVLNVALGVASCFLIFPIGKRMGGATVGLGGRMIFAAADQSQTCQRREYPYILVLGESEGDKATSVTRREITGHGPAVARSPFLLLLCGMAGTRRDR